MATTRKYHITLLAFVLVASVALFTYAQAQKPLGGHLANLIGPGTFATGNYIFPNNLDVNGALKSGGKNVCLADGTNCPLGSTTPPGNFNTACAALATNIGSPVVINRPPCLTQPGGCSIRVVTPGSGHMRAEINAKGSQWHSVILGRNSEIRFTSGQFDNAGAQSFFIGDASSQCDVTDDDLATTGKIRMTGAGCDFYLCP